MRATISIKSFGILLGPLVFLATYFFFKPAGLSDTANVVLATTLWMAIWWMTEVLPISITALLPIVVFPMSGALPIEDVTACFGHEYIFLYIGGFILAIAIERWGLHKRIALNIIYLIGSNVRYIILGFMAATAFISMWISNTATAVLMMPIGLAIVAQLRDNPATREDENLVFGKALMLSIAYSATIGGMATLVGSPPNLVLAGVVKDFYQVDVSFYDWFVIGFPFAFILLFVVWKILTSVTFKFPQQAFPGGRDEIGKQLQALGKITYEEKAVLTVFILTALAWITRSFFLNRFFPHLDDTVIAMMAAFVLFLIPTSGEGKKPFLTWEEAVKLPWGILLLFGGGLAIAEGFKTSGLAEWIGLQMASLSGVHLMVLLLAIILSVNFLTEVTSNLATTAMILPILAPLALALDVHPFGLLIGATLAASCAFMLPVATPPNAVVFGSGYLKINDMVRAGILLNITSSILLAVFMYYLLPFFLGYDPEAFPAEFKK